MTHPCKVFKPDKDGQLKLDRIISAEEVNEMLWENLTGNQRKQRALSRLLKKKPPTFNEYPKHLTKGTQHDNTNRSDNR